jgi:ankyrin repeat protein
MRDSDAAAAASDRLLESIRSGDLVEIDRLLSTDPALAASRDERGVSILMNALYHRRPEIAERVLDAGIDPDVHEAAALGNVERVRTWLDSSGDLIEHRAADGFTPLHLAAYFSHPPVVRLLIERGAGVDAEADNPSRVRPVHSAVAARSAEIVRILLEAGADPNVQQHGGWTALHAAAQHGDGALVRILLDHGADAGLQSDDGRTAADFARAGGHDDVAALLTG